MEFLARLQRPFQFASAVFFALLLPAAAVGGGMALPALISLFALLSIRPPLLRQAFETRPLAIGLLLAFTAWAAASAFWSPWSNHSQALKLVLLVPLGFLFASAANRNEADRRLVRWASL